MVAQKVELEISILWNTSCEFSSVLGAKGIRKQTRKAGKEIGTGEQVGRWLNEGMPLGLGKNLFHTFFLQFSCFASNVFHSKKLLLKIHCFKAEGFNL